MRIIDDSAVSRLVDGTDDEDSLVKEFKVTSLVQISVNSCSVVCQNDFRVVESAVESEEFTNVLLVVLHRCAAVRSQRFVRIELNFPACERLKIILDFPH